MIRNRGLICLAGLLLFCFSKLMGQEDITQDIYYDSDEAEALERDTIPKKTFKEWREEVWQWETLVPYRFRFGTDLSRLGWSIFNANDQMAELHSDLDFGKLQFMADAAFFSTDIRGTSFRYENGGRMYRAGISYNIYPIQDPGHVFFFGLQYAWNFYNENLQIRNQSSFSLWDGQQQDLNNPSLQASWLEIIAGMKVNIGQNFYLGYTLRYKFSMDLDGAQSFNSYRIPGYGLNGNDSRLAMNYHIFYSLPIKKYKEKDLLETLEGQR